MAVALRGSTWDEDHKSAKSSTQYKVTNFQVKPEIGVSGSLYAVWTWKYNNQTDKYKIRWRYYTGGGAYFVGSESEGSISTSSNITAKYSPPDNAIQVICEVLPVSKTYKKKKGKTEYEATYWTATWNQAYYTISDPRIPAIPAVPTVTIDNNYKITARLDNISDANTTHIEFQVVKNDTTVVKSGISAVRTSVASCNWYVDAGSQYKVRARGLRATQNIYVSGDWSDYSSNVSTVPKTPAAITRHVINSANSIYLYWNTVRDATSYTVEYAKSKAFFDSSTEVQSITVTNTHAYISGIDSGTTWYFRVKATNGQGDSGWSPIYSVVIGVIPTAPTTWSQTASAIAGETINLYWVHNSGDGSTQANAVVQVALDNGEWVDYAPTYKSTEDGVASYLSYNTYLTEEEDIDDDDNLDITDSSGSRILTEARSAFAEGVTLKWRVKTKGVMNTGGDNNDGYGPWSAVRTVTVYGPPSLEMIVSNTSGANYSNQTITRLPIYISATAEPDSQTAVGWNLIVKSNSFYETYDETGERTTVNVGDEVYSKYFDGGTNTFNLALSAGNISLLNGMSYTVLLSAGMNSGLDASDERQINISWEEDEYWPNAEVAIDEENLCAYIRPYCLDENDEYVSNMTLSVYRRDYDGRLIEIATGIDNTGETTVTDPHPALDYARYRIVTISTNTGQVGYYDLPAEKVGETGIIIQWDEEWSDFDIPSGDGDGLADPAWSGSMLKLPYNIKVSEKTNIDKSLVEYIGRSAPVSYYGTQLGVSGSWSSDIPASDVNTRYALRRLQIWPGDVYVREPSGVGYWANINVSFSKDYTSMLTPISIEVTRVEGGM